MDEHRGWALLGADGSTAIKKAGAPGMELDRGRLAACVCGGGRGWVHPDSPRGEAVRLWWKAWEGGARKAHAWAGERDGERQARAWAGERDGDWRGRGGGSACTSFCAFRSAHFFMRKSTTAE